MFACVRDPRKQIAPTQPMLYVVATNALEGVKIQTMTTVLINRSPSGELKVSNVDDHNMSTNRNASEAPHFLRCDYHYHNYLSENH